MSHLLCAGGRGGGKSTRLYPEKSQKAGMMCPVHCESTEKGSDSRRAAAMGHALGVAELTA